MATPAITTTSKTLENLQAAFNGESNAHAKYTEFAKKADADGYNQVASLFRAAARAEQIHAQNHARVIRKMGAEPVANIEAHPVNSTRENLQAAIEGETYERDVMYPEFIREAEAAGNKSAVRTFHAALEAEKEHARLYALALNNLEQMKVAAKYYVCAVCGYTVDAMTFAQCPVCNAPGERFEAIS